MSVQLKATFHLPLIGVKKNPQSPTFTNLGVITKGTIVEVSELGCSLPPLQTSLNLSLSLSLSQPIQVNISELGLVTQSGKVVWGEFEDA